MPAFFVPAAKDNAEAEQVYEAFRAFVNAPEGGPRIYSLNWQHNGQHQFCEVGQPMPNYFQTGGEPVLAIFDCGNHYKICTPNRGGVRGEPILAGKDHMSNATTFTDS